MGLVGNRNFKNHFYNNWCINFLMKLGYDVPPFTNSLGRIIAHILLLLFDVGILIVSWLTVKEIAFFTFGLHFLNLLYSWLVLLLNMNNYNNAYNEKFDAVKNTAVNQREPHSPYHAQFHVVSVIILVLVFMMFLSFISVPGIKFLSLYSLTTYLSIVITFSKSVLMVLF